MQTMKTTITAIGLALAAGLPALAQSAADTASASAEMAARAGDLIRSRDITGGDVYTTNAARDEGWEIDSIYDTVGADWNLIGEIEDVVLGRDGEMRGIVAEVGGVLDLADKHVMVAVEDVNLVAVDDAEYAFVTRLNEEELEALPDVDEAFWD